MSIPKKMIVEEITATKKAVLPGLNYIVYSAKMIQESTNDPDVLIFENNIGDIFWEREDVGIYKGALNDIFIENRLFILNNFCSFLTISEIITIKIFRENDDNIKVETMKGNNQGDLSYSDGVLNDYPLFFELRIYNEDVT